MQQTTHAHPDPIKTGRTNHFIDDVGMKGILQLNADSLCFETHHMNFKQYNLCMPLKTIQSVQLKNNLRFFPYGIVVMLQDGSSHRFAVWGRKRWIQAILGEIAKDTQNSTKKS
jgi:hypothetical protein